LPDQMLHDTSNPPSDVQFFRIEIDGLAGAPVTGEGDGEGDGDGLGEGDGDGLGEGEGDGDGLGEGVGVGFVPPPPAPATVTGRPLNVNVPGVTGGAPLKVNPIETLVFGRIIVVQVSGVSVYIVADGPAIFAFHTEVSACGVLKVVVQPAIGLVVVFEITRYAVYPLSHWLATAQVIVTGGTATVVAPWARLNKVSSKRQRKATLRHA